MNLLLWRHAEAVDGTPDHDRHLTSRGERQAQKVAAWLEQHQPKKLRVLVSPTVRTVQTARMFRKQFEIVPTLAPGARTAELIAACGWPDHAESTLIVGHQPSLGQLAALLVSNSDTAWSIKKGALWWISNRVREGQAQSIMRTIIAPDLL